jgi:hypothetical protein
MAARKKWRLKLYPSFTYCPAPSMKQAYAIAVAIREQYAQNLSPIHQVEVEVYEDQQWKTFERLTFPERDGDA